jgi:hypothetical protein
MLINIILISLIILLFLPTINYNFKIIFAIFLIYLLIYPEHRKILYNNINIKENIQDPNQINNKLNILLNEGKNIIKELKQYNSPIYLSIKFSWKKITKISNLISQNQSISYPHHLYTILKDQKYFILNQISSIIINTEPLNISERTLLIDRTLPLDKHIRYIIRKLNVVIDNILKIISTDINNNWINNTSTEISPVDLDFNNPEPYNYNQSNLII